MELSPEEKALLSAVRSSVVDTEYSLRTTKKRSSHRQGERPYAESRSRSKKRSNSLSCIESVSSPELKCTVSDSDLSAVRTVSVSSQTVFQVDLATVGTQTIACLDLIERGIMANEEVKVSARFIGRFRTGVDPEKDRSRYSYYTVHRWLRDTESRISSKKITTDEGKIHEARLGVHPEIGDASAMLHSSSLSEITDWEGFKTQCRNFWRSEVEEALVTALSALLHTPVGATSGETVAAHSQAVNDVIAVVTNKPPFKVAKASVWQSAKPDEVLVSLKSVMTFVSVTVHFGSLAAKPQEVLLRLLEKLDLDEENLVTLNTKFTEELHKQRVTGSELACYASSNDYGKKGSKGRWKQRDNKEGRDEKKDDDKGKGAKKKVYRCYRCKGEGHFRKDCPSKPKEGENRKREGKGQDE